MHPAYGMVGAPADAGGGADAPLCCSAAGVAVPLWLDDPLGLQPVRFATWLVPVVLVSRLATPEARDEAPDAVHAAADCSPDEAAETALLKPSLEARAADPLTMALPAF